MAQCLTEIDEVKDEKWRNDPRRDYNNNTHTKIKPSEQLNQLAYYQR